MISPSLRSTSFLRLCSGSLLYFGMTLGALSQSDVHLTGRVSDPSGAHLSGALITATDEQTGRTIKVVAGFDGAYSIDMPAGIYSFTFSANGHTGATFHHVTVPHPDGAAPLDAVLPLLTPQGDHASGEHNVPIAHIDGHPLPPSDISRYTTGRSFLVGNEAEESGFGLYSYLLFSSRPVSDTEKQRDLAVVRAFVDGMQDVGDLEASGVAKGDLNVTYLLVVGHPPENVPSPEWVLSNYNFARAQALLLLLGRGGHDVLRGPYVVSGLTPLSHLTQVPEPHLWQDMSSVSATVAASWEKEFMRCANRKQFWAPDTRNQALLGLRDLIANSAEAMIMVNGSAVGFKKMLMEWVSWN
jgi:hypothetical protein